jgi:hypothetical protein
MIYHRLLELAQLVEQLISDPKVEGSNPGAHATGRNSYMIFRFFMYCKNANVPVIY